MSLPPTCGQQSVTLLHIGDLLARKLEEQFWNVPAPVLGENESPYPPRCVALSAHTSLL